MSDLKGNICIEQNFRIPNPTKSSTKKRNQPINTLYYLWIQNRVYWGILLVRFLSAAFYWLKT